MRSPNFGPRRDGLRPNMAVIHYTVMGFQDSVARLCDRAAEVSAHYVIDRDGTLLALVDEEMRAWHAGQGAWRGLADINSRSIGIELVNNGAEPFAEPQMSRLEALLADIIHRYQMELHNVIGHSDMAPGRKADPGPRFDWARLAKQGLSLATPRVASPKSELSEADFVARLHRFGYPDAPASALLASFRARFRPMAQGPLDEQDCALADALAALVNR